MTTKSFSVNDHICLNVSLDIFFVIYHLEVDYFYQIICMSEKVSMVLPS